MTNPMPKHVALIMDGNGRWAQAKGLPRLEGHRQGVKTLRAMIEAGADIGLEYMTFYAFSSENWKRPQEEVSGLMSLLKHFLSSELKTMQKNGVRLRIFGDKRLGTQIPNDILKMILDAEEKTKDNTKININMCFNYGGRDEVIRAAQLFADDVERGLRFVGDLDEVLFSKYLDTADVPDPELMIRTGGDRRISNFLIYQLSYAELFFEKEFWPDFTKEHLVEIINEYRGIERRFGGLSA